MILSPDVRPPVRPTGGSIYADARQLPLGLDQFLGGVVHQGDRRPPGDQPAQVGGEGIVQLDADRADDVVGGVGAAVAQIDHPLTPVDPAQQLGRVDRSGRGQVDRNAARTVHRAHLRVVGGMIRQTTHQSFDKVVLVLDRQRQID